MSAAARTGPAAAVSRAPAGSSRPAAAAVDQARQGGDHGRLEPRPLDRAREQPHGLQRLHGLAEAAGDLVRRHALGQQLAGAAVAGGGRQRGGHQVAGAAAPHERARLPAGQLGQGEHLEEDVRRGHAGGVEALALGGADRHRRGVLRHARQLDAHRVVGDLAHHAGALEHLGHPVRQRLGVRGAHQSRARLHHLARMRGAPHTRRALGPERALERHGRAACRRAARGPWPARPRPLSL